MPTAELRVYVGRREGGVPPTAGVGLDLFQASPVAQVSIDPAGAMHVLNGALARLLGVSADEAEGRPLHRYLSRGSWDRWFDHVALIFAGATDASVELALRTGAQPRRWVRVISAPLPSAAGVPRALCTVLDISAERESFRRLRASEQSFRSLVERSPEAILIHSNGLIHYANPAAAALIGVEDPEDLVGDEVAKLVLKEDRALALERWQLAQSRGTALPPIQLRIRRSPQPARVESIDLALIFDGRPAIVTIARDLTERLALQSRLARTDRLSTMGVMTAGLAHEINNPLMYMLTNTELVREELTAALGLLGDLGPAAAPLQGALAGCLTLLADVEEGEQRIARLVGELRRFSRVDERAEQVDPGRVVQAALRVAEPHLKDRAELCLDLEPVEKIRGNEGQLFQVALNLLVNAAQAIPIEGRTRGRVQVHLRMEAGAVRLTVQDNGVGMSADVLDQVFDPFFTTKALGEGTGLGLSICASIVRDLGGRLWATSKPGEGSHFELLLPACREPAPVTQRPAQSLAAGPPRRILVVDDEAAICSGLARALGARHRIDTAPSAEDALRILGEDGDYDLILSDLMMEGGDGMWLHGAIAQAHPRLLPRLAFMTGGPALPRAQAFAQHSRAVVLQKPLTRAQIEALLQTLPPRPDQAIV